MHASPTHVDMVVSVIKLQMALSARALGIMMDGCAPVGIMRSQ